jgi:ribonuclease HII
MLHAGIDEAGYGPTLGPLAIVRVAARCDDLAALTAALAAAGVRDSKTVHKAGNLASLERVALPAAAWFSGFAPDTAADLFGLLGEDASLRADIPWMAGAAQVRLPVEAPSVTAWTLPAEPAGLAGFLVQPRAYTAWLRSRRNKAALELERIGRLLAELPDEPADVVVDRLGGRKFYGDWLATVWPGAEATCESENISTYRTGTRAVSFCVGGESVSPLTAAASCLAKYARELHMLLLNRWWCAKLPWLKPTAGYPQDAARWLHQIGDGHRGAWAEDLIRDENAGRAAQGASA